MKDLKPQISVICFDCGKECVSIDTIGYGVTCWNGVCDVCGKFKTVTSSRHFNVKG